MGADGIHSKVREHVLGPRAPVPTFDNICIVYGFLPAAAAVKPFPEYKFPAIMFAPSGTFMVMPVDPEGKTLAWVINKPSKERTRQEWQEMERSGEAARQAKAEFDDITSQPMRSLLDNADNTKARIWAPYSIEDLPTWHTARVCLIGDAAHGLPPDGQGTAMAFEDAALMTRLLSEREENDSYEELFERFEAIRKPRIDSVKESKKPGGTRERTGSWVWALKKLAFTGFFWFNGGVVKFLHGSEYDIEKAGVKAQSSRGWFM